MIDHTSLQRGAGKGNQVLNIEGRGVLERPSMNMCHNWNLVILLIHFYFL